MKQLVLIPSIALVALTLIAWPRQGAPDAQVALARAHYAEVEAELSRTTPIDLTAAQLAERERLIEVLRAYRERGVFGHQSVEPGARVPQFVDRDGRRCAVAELLHQSGEDELVAAVARTNNRAWVVDLADDEEFRGWLGRSGLSLADAARIQLPHTDGVGGGGGRVGRKASDTYAGPGDSVPRGSGSAPRNPSAPSAPESPAPAGGPTPTGSGPVPTAWPLSPASASADASTDASWWGWWEYNKLAFLRVRPLETGLAPGTGAFDAEDRGEAFRAQLEAMRKAFVPTFAAGLADADAQVRGEAVIALGRVGGQAAVPAILGMMSDSSVLVRNRAILALGATGAPAARAALLAIAKSGALEPEARGPVSGGARPLAIVALALGRKAGFAADTDVRVAHLVRERAGADRERVAIAGLMYQMLAPCAELELVAMEIAGDEKQATEVRARAIESLRSSRSTAVLSKLQTLLHGKDIDLRRSAALTLGGFQNDLALSALMTAFELENEPVTRAFTLIAVGQQGGDIARTFLIDALRGPQSQLRPWAALGLGIVARRDGDVIARDAVRKALTSEKNRDSLPAYWIALGLARDEQAVDTIYKSLQQAVDPRHRMYAATALSLAGGERAREALLEQGGVETSALVRVTIAQGLGQFDHPADSQAILDTLRGVREAQLQGLAAVAMGFHGTTLDVSGLAKVLEDPKTAVVARAAAFDALGMLLSRAPALELAHASQGANYTLFDMWVDELFQVTL